jgi:hypothetical protein
VGDSRRKPVLLVAVIAAGLWAGAAGVGFAGSGNVLYLLQDSGSYSTGESFQSDQSSSINSSIGWFEAPALQRGSDDSASVTIDSSCDSVSNSCGHADLTQDSDYISALARHPDAPGWLGPVLAGLSLFYGGNSTNVTVIGQGSAEVRQYGFGNRADVTATDGAASIIQAGLGNYGKLTVTPLMGEEKSGNFELKQFGIGNSVNLEVSTPAGTTSHYTQIGAGLAPDSTVPVVISSNTPIDVTHTGFGTYHGR